MKSVEEKCFQIWNVLRERHSPDNLHILCVNLLYFYETGILESYLKGGAAQFSNFHAFLADLMFNIKYLETRPVDQDLFYEIANIFFQERIYGGESDHGISKKIGAIYKIFNESNITGKEFFDGFLAISIGYSKFNRREPPNEVAELMIFLSNTSKDEVVYNPFSGYNTLAFKVANYKQLITQEELIRSRSIGLINSYINNLNPFEETDNFTSLATSPLEDDKSTLADCIISMPPFGLRLSAKKSFWVIPDLLMKYVDSLKEDQLKRVVVLLEPGASWHPSFKNFRKEIIENDLLDYVIELPKNTLGFTAMESAIWSLKKNCKEVKHIQASHKKSKNLVLTNDSSQMEIDLEDVKKIIKSKSHSEKYVFNKIDLIQRDYSLKLGIYKQAQMDGVKLSKYLVHVSSRPFKTLQLTDSKLSIIWNDDLVSDFINHDELRTTTEVTDELINNISTSTRFYTKSMLESQNSQLILIPSYIGKKNKPSILQLDERIYGIHSSIKVFINTSNQMIDEFIIHELSKSNALQQMDFLRKGRSLGLDDILKLKIQVIGLDEQRRLINELKIRKKELTQLASEYDRKIEKVKDENFTNFATLKHETGDNRVAIATNTQLLKDFFFDEKNKELAEQLDKKFQDEHDGEYSIKEALDMIQNSISDLTRQIESQKYMISTKGQELKELSINELEDLFIEFEKKYKKFFQLEFQIDYKQDDLMNALALYNPELLKMMFDNLLRNSREHAFSNSKSRFENVVRVIISVDADQDSISISYTDNGNGFPDYFTHEDFITVGKSNTGILGRGQGGQTINEIAIFHKNEDWKLIKHKNSEFSTEFIFNLKPTFYE